MKIADIKLDNPVVLAPMSGICDIAFRKIIKTMGCGLIETEMISEKSVIQHNEKTREMLEISECEKPVSLQLFGSDVETFKIASSYVEENTNADIIDINMGCPVRKVAEYGKSGSALLKNPQKAYDIVSSVVESVDLPVTVKIRSGWDKTCINAVEIAQIVEDAGASAITVHPRTKTQGYSGSSDWSIINDVKKSVSIPVIGNGDIYSCYDAKEMMKYTDCDAIMIARGVLGNPWLIKESIDYIEKGIKPKKVDNNEKLEIIKKHAQLLNCYTTKEITLVRMKKHAAYYVKGLYRSSMIKNEIFKTNSIDELIQLLEKYFEILR